MRAFLDAVWDRYKDWSSTELWNLTHSQRPWMDHYEPGAFRKAIQTKRWPNISEPKLLSMNVSRTPMLWS